MSNKTLVKYRHNPKINPKEIRNNTFKQVKLICQERTGHMVYGVLGYYIY